MALTIEERITIKFQRWICRNYCKNHRASFHRQERDIDWGTGQHSVPDGLVICCARRGNETLKELHTIEAKSIRLIDECRATGNRLPIAFVQARDYLGNYNWLILEKNLWDELTRDERQKLINLCNTPTRYSKGVGLAVVSSSNVQRIQIRVIVGAVRSGGDFQRYYPNLEVNCVNCNSR